MMSLFYKQFIESVLSFCIVAWYGNLSLSNKNRLGGPCEGGRQDYRC